MGEWFRGDGKHGTHNHSVLCLYRAHSFQLWSSMMIYPGRLLLIVSRSQGRKPTWYLSRIDPPPHAIERETCLERLYMA